MRSINICICTFRRPKLIEQCLDSIARMTLPEGATATVTVVDNDVEESARPIVERLASTFPAPLHYFQEPKRGIPCARNRAIEETIRRGSDYLVFIDDDEWVDSDWLHQLYDYSERLGGSAVVSGKVIPQLPATTPEAIRHLFKEKCSETGDRLSTCATNNVIIPRHLFTALGLRFDESIPLAGGTDTIFFVQAHALGVDIVRCNEAVVYEEIPVSRTTLKWLAHRKYRAGITDAWRKRQRGRSRSAIFLRALLLTTLESIKALLLALVMNQRARNKCWLKACKYAGVVAGVAGVSVESYTRVDGT